MILIRYSCAHLQNGCTIHRTLFVFVQSVGVSVRYVFPILYSKISTDPGVLKIRYSHRLVAVVIQILMPFACFSRAFHVFFPAPLVCDLLSRTRAWWLLVVSSYRQVETCFGLRPVVFHFALSFG